MTFTRHFLPLILALGLPLLGSEWVVADTISWLEKRESLSKPGYSRDTASHSVYSDSGANRMTLALSHESTSRDLFTFSKWEIDRWGDPTGQQTASEGSWQVVSNTANDVVLGMWGYWGWDGAPQTPRLTANEATTYELTLQFDRPVTELTLPIHGINALLTNGQYNCVDELSANGFLGNTSVANVRFESLGTGVKRHAGGITGDLQDQVSSGTSTYDEGTVHLIATKKLDRIVLRFSNRSVTHPNGTFSNGQQAWSLSLGDLSFENELTDATRNATAIEWLPRKGQLSKPGFSVNSATTTALSKDGRVRVGIALEHDQTTPNLTTYSKWEIDQWGDPTGELFSPGSWQIVTDSANSVVLGLWGYWGGPGETAAIGNSTSYRLILEFDHPVHDLTLPLHGINGFLKPANGFNSGDEVEITASRGGTPTSSPTYADMGQAMKQIGSKLVGDYTYQIDDGISGQHMSNEGSCKARFTEPVDRLVLTVTNRSGHPTPAQHQNGMQTWSMALGDLTFTHEAPTLTNLARQAGVTVTQSSTLHPHTAASHLADGGTNGNLWDLGVSHTDFEDQPWIEIDLGAIRNMSEVLLWTRTDTLATSLDDLILFVSNQPFASQVPSATEASTSVTTLRQFDPLATGHRVDLDLSGRYLRVQREGAGALSLAEIEVLGPASNATATVPPATVAHETLSIDSSSPNPLLNQLGHFALISDAFPAGLDIEETATGVDLLFQRPTGLQDLLGYHLELSSDLVDWTAVTIESSPLETLRLQAINAIIPTLAQRGFARLRITVPATGETTTTKAVGWYSTSCHQGFQTHGLSLNRPAFGVGHIVSLEGTLKATISSTLDLSNLGPAYMEVIDGTFEGHRLELQAITNGDGTALLEGTSTGSTLTDLSNSIIGASVIVRPHWTLDTAYPAATATPHRDPASAGQVLFYDNGRYRTFYSIDDPDHAYWTELGDSSLQNKGLATIPPGQGIFLCQPDGQPHEVTIVGHVRDTLFKQPLEKGHHLVAQVYPVAQSPRERLLDQASGFQGASDPSLSDTIQVWQGDHNPTAEAFESYFYFTLPPGQTQPYWVDSSDNTLASQNEAPLFQADRAAFVELQADRPLYQINLTLPNQ